MFIRDSQGRQVPVDFGTVTNATIGFIMRECAVRAMRTIRRMRFDFEASEKGLKSDGKMDWVTNADLDLTRPIGST